MGSDDFNTSASDDRDGGPGNTQRPFKAIRHHCLWCCSESTIEVRLCSAMSCPLWPHRLGRNPTADMVPQLGDRPIHPLEHAITAAEFQRTAAHA